MSNRILKAGFKVVSVCFERVKGVYLARHAGGYIEVSQKEYEEMKGEILRTGFYEVKPVLRDDRSLTELLGDVFSPCMA